MLFLAVYLRNIFVDMETPILQHLAPLGFMIFPMELQVSNTTSKDMVGFPAFRAKAYKRIGYSRIVPFSKRSAYQDFQGFAKPSRLLSATKSYTIKKYIPDGTLSTAEQELNNSNSYYVIELNTSKDFGSGLAYLNGAILLSLIDKNGDSILQRISPISLQSSNHREYDIETIHFQRGSVDIVSFKGPRLTAVESIWIGLESGSWRLDGASLTVINRPDYLSDSTTDSKQDNIQIMQYKFEANNIFLGEGGESIAELRPIFVTESSNENLTTLLKNTSPSLSTSKMSNEESMKEYSNLKFSLLLYDFMIFFFGSSIILLFSHDERYAYSFFGGGVAGFFYLLLIQRSVDGLSTDNNLTQGSVNLKGPLFGFLLIIATSIVAAKYGIGGYTVALTPAELFIGAAGFLSSKIAILLAAFKPIDKI